MVNIRGWSGRPDPDRSRPNLDFWSSRQGPSSEKKGTTRTGDDGSPIDEMVPRRREARAMLGSLLRPYRMTLAPLALVVVVKNAARLSVPLLVQRGIDRGIPPIVNRSPTPRV
jgi:hypothetical protein